MVNAAFKRRMMINFFCQFWLVFGTFKMIVVWSTSFNSHVSTWLYQQRKGGGPAAAAAAPLWMASIP